MARIARATLDKIRGRIDLIRLIEESGVALRRSGRGFVGKCPFHQDDTPSFSVSPDKGLYYCFGCGASGTAFTYVSKREQIPFDEAVKRLATRAGVAVEELSEDAPTSEEQQISGANRFARDRFHDWLIDNKTGADALRYLEERGVTRETIGDLKLGYAPDGWDNLLNEMKRVGFEQDILVEAGLLRQNDQGRRYDYFRRRIIFPISDLDGTIVGFGGRALDDATPKYLNSPDTPLYKKSNVLYFLDRARPSINEERVALIAEGYMDVIALYQAGIENVVASLGTALSESHARLLKRYTDEVKFVFDGDEAGSRAVSRGAPHFLREGFRVSVTSMPEGQDPDDFVREQGAEGFLKRVRDASPLVEFYLGKLAADTDLSNAETKVDIIGQAAELLRHIQSPIILRDHAERLARDLNITSQEVWSELRRNRVYIKSPPSDQTDLRAMQRKPRTRIERQLLACLLNAPATVLRVFEEIAPRDFQEPTHQELARILWETARDDVIEPRALMDACFDDDVRALIGSLLLETRPLPRLDQEIQAHVDKMIQDTLRQMEMEHLESRLKDEKTDELELAKDLRELSKQRREMREARKTETP